MQAYNTAYTSFTEPVESTQHFGSKVVSHWVEQLLMGNNFLIKSGINSFSVSPAIERSRVINKNYYVFIKYYLLAPIKP